MTQSGAVLVTGGRSGIGRALAEGLLGTHLPICTVRKEADLKQLQDAGLAAVVFDVTNDAHVEPAVAAVAALLAEKGLKLTGVVANAGINPEGDAITAADASGDPRPSELCECSVATAVFATNVVGVARTARAFLPLLRESGEGRLLIVGSCESLLPAHTRSFAISFMCAAASHPHPSIPNQQQTHQTNPSLRILSEPCMAGDACFFVWQTSGAWRAPWGRRTSTTRRRSTRWRASPTGSAGPRPGEACA